MNKFLQLFLTFTFIFSINNFLNAQKGPGGVGDINGSSSLILWLDADRTTGNNGAVVSDWADLSGKGNNFNAGNGAVYRSNHRNGMAAFSFDGTAQYLERAYSLTLNPNSFSLFSANKAEGNSNYKSVVTSRNEGEPEGTKGFILYSDPNENWLFWTGQDASADIPGSWNFLNSSVSTTNNWAHQCIEYTDASSFHSLYVNGKNEENKTVDMLYNRSEPFRVGAGSSQGSTPSFYFKGDIGEIIMFNTVVNSAQRMIIDNYLSAKYNYLLADNDLYTQDNTSAGNYDYDVAGIGRTNSASNSNSSAQGTGIVRVSNPQNLGNGEFLFWGHDAGSRNMTTSTNIPTGIDARYERIWRVSEVGEVGSIDMDFDMNSTVISTAEMRLLVDTNNDGSFADETPISGATDLGNSVYRFAGVSAINDNVRFTVAKAAAALPVELVNFSVAFDKNAVHLSWQTLSEKNNDYFTVQRSTNGQNWQNISRTEGAGNSDSILSYKETDKQYLTGTSYYRLQQTDFDGTQSYSEIRKTEITHTEIGEILLFPNPAQREITLQGKINNIPVEVFSATGINVNFSVNIIERENEFLRLDISALKPGYYVVKIGAMTHRFYKK